MIAILQYQSSLVDALKSTLGRVGETVDGARSFDQLERATRIIFPACRSFPSAIRDLRDGGFLPYLFRAIDNGVPILGIDQGMHLLFDVSYIEGQHTGLGVMLGKVDAGVSGASHHASRRSLQWTGDHALFSGIGAGAEFYFDNDHYVTPLDEATIVARTQNGNSRVAAVAEKNLTGVQFRPEESGEAGLKVLENFAKFG
jgi:imidazole glycerol phosphate synthase glutamine amidotransferase subunit